MSPREERLIERFVRAPDNLSQEHRQNIKRLIEDDPGARAYAEFLRGFYERFEMEASEPPSERVDEFVESLFSGEKGLEEENTVVSLRPFQSRGEARPTVLAAETGTMGASMGSSVSPDERRFSVLTTLEAETENLLVRVVGDREAGKGRLYVLAKPAEKRAHVVVSFPGLGLELIANQDGRRAFDLPPEIPPEDWADAQAVVRRPLVTRTVGPGEEAVLSLPGGGTLTGKRKGRTLRGTFDARRPDGPSRLTVTSPEHPPRLLRLDGASPLEWEVPREGPLTLRVYE